MLKKGRPGSSYLAAQCHAPKLEYRCGRSWRWWKRRPPHLEENIRYCFLNLFAPNFLQRTEVLFQNNPIGIDQKSQNPKFSRINFEVGEKCCELRVLVGEEHRRPLVFRCAQHQQCRACVAFRRLIGAVRERRRRRKSGGRFAAKVSVVFVVSAFLSTFFVCVICGPFR